VHQADGTCSKHGDIRVGYRSCLIQNFRDVGKDKKIVLKYVLYLKDKNI